MKARHAAALALVSWYAMYPPLKCIDELRNDLGSCDMHYDTRADLWEWQEGRGFPTAEACTAFIANARHLAGDLKNQRKVEGMKCVTWKELHKAEQVRRAKRLRNFPAQDSDEPLQP